MNFDKLLLKNANERKEYALLGNLYFHYSDHVFDECITKELKPEHFYSKQCAQWYSHGIDQVIERGGSPDSTDIPVDMVERMPEDCFIAEGSTYKLIEDIKKMHKTRQFIQGLALATQNVQEGKSVEMSYQEIEKTLDYKENSKKVQDITIDELYNIEEDKKGLPTHVDPWDKRGVKLTSGDIYAIGGDTGSGKTTVTTNLAARQLIQGNSVLYVSLEETTHEILRKFLAIISGYSKEAIKSGKADREKIEKAHQKIIPYLHVIDNGLITTQKLTAWVKMTQKINDYKLIVIDYWQLLGQNDPGEGIREKLIFCADRLKHLAKVCEVPILVVGQVDKASAKQRGGLGRNDFSDSKQLSNNASYVIMIEHNDTNITATIKKSRQPNHNGILVELEMDPVTEHITFKG